MKDRIRIVGLIWSFLSNRGKGKKGWGNVMGKERQNHIHLYATIHVACVLVHSYGRIDGNGVDERHR